MVIAAYLHDPVVHLTSAAGLALLLGASALHKLRDRPGFAQVLAGYDHAFGGRLPVAALAWALPLLELLAAVGVLASFWSPLAAWPAALLLALYAAVLALGARRGAVIGDCGCHLGGTRQPPSCALAWRNLLLVVLALNLLAPVAARPLTGLDAPVLGFALGCGVALYLLANLLISNRLSLREP